MTHFNIQRELVTSYVYEFPVEDEVAEQLAGGKVQGTLPGGGSYKLDLWPRDVANLDAGVKLQLVITTTKTEQKGDQP